jgi:putative ABC transport system permease protein
MNNFFEPLSTAWVGLVTHKLRSILTILGVVIGVGAVITLMSIGQGTETAILNRIQSLGSNLVFIQPGAASDSGVVSAPGSAATLTQQDATAIGSNVRNTTVVSPYTSTLQQVVVGATNTRAPVVGVTPAYLTALNLQAATGSLINDYENNNSMSVALLGATVEQTLFGTANAVGQQIRIGNSLFTVGGVLQVKGASISSILGSTDDSILIPLKTFQTTLSQAFTISGQNIVSGIVLTVSDKNGTDQVKNDITALLRSRHLLASGATNDFTVTSVDELAQTSSATASNLTALLAAIAGISLLVGGIGVMNIMLVSVVERTREIGIRKALGARERDIWGQFLTEASFLSLTGGIIGVLAGYGASRVVAHLASLTTVVSGSIVLLAISVSIAIGLFFGFYPAWQASRLDPIQALRAE